MHDLEDLLSFGQPEERLLFGRGDARTDIFAEADGSKADLRKPGVGASRPRIDGGDPCLFSDRPGKVGGRQQHGLVGGEQLALADERRFSILQPKNRRRSGGRLHGVELPRDSDQQADIGAQVDPGPDFGRLRVGDLCFFAEDARRVTHVALSLGGSAIIHSSLGNGGVFRNDLAGSLPYERELRDLFVVARRVL